MWTSAVWESHWFWSSCHYSIMWTPAVWESHWFWSPCHYSIMSRRRKEWVFTKYKEMNISRAPQRWKGCPRGTRISSLEVLKNSWGLFDAIKVLQQRNFSHVTLNFFSKAGIPLLSLSHGTVLLAALISLLAFLLCLFGKIWMWYFWFFSSLHYLPQWGQLHSPSLTSCLIFLTDIKYLFSLMGYIIIIQYIL